LTDECFCGAEQSIASGRAAAIRAASPLGWTNTNLVSAELEVIELESFLACEAVALA
jgi:hypothetical protein